MKALILSTLFIGSAAFAGVTEPILKDDKTVGLVELARIVKVRSERLKCARNEVCETLKYATIDLQMNGCANRPGPVTAVVKFNDVEKVHEIFITAVQINNHLSETLDCQLKDLHHRIKVLVPEDASMENLELRYAPEVLSKPVIEKSGPKPTACPQVYAPVCGIRKRKCPPGRICTTVMPSPKTYSNSCYMLNDRATLLYQGKCRSTR